MSRWGSITKRGAVIICAMLIALRSSGDARAEIVIQHVNIVDTRNGSIIMDRDVVVADEIIAGIGQGGTLQPSAEGKTVDGRDRYLIPGLWDMHTHIAMDEVLDSVPGYDRTQLELLIANGITGVRDMGGSWQRLARYREAIARGEMIGPRIVATSLMIDGPGEAFPASIIVKSPEEARAAVRRLHAEGAPFIKLQSHLVPSTFRAALDEGRALKLDVVGHVPPALAGHPEMLRMKSIEHLTGVIFKSERIPYFAGELIKDQDQRMIIEDFARAGVWQVPTLVAMRPYMDPNNRALRSDDRLQLIPRALINNVWEAELAGLAKSRTISDQQEIKNSYEKVRRRLVKEMQDAGVGILAGTDLVGAYLIPGFSLHDEILALSGDGLTTLEALQTATINPARYFGMAGVSGYVKEGDRADLVVLDGDPIEDLANLDRVSAVIAAGRLYDKRMIDKIFADAKARH